MKTDEFKINLNQNVWILIISLITLGLSEYYCLKTLFVFGFILSIISTISIFITTISYTLKYFITKLKNK
jgi:hypothetical protein